MEKLLAIITIAQRSYCRWLFQRLLPGIIMIIGLTIVISIMISAIIVGGLYTAYSALLNYELEENMAMLIIGISSIITIITLVIIVLLGMRRMRPAPKIISSQSQISICAIGIFTSFIDGFMAE
jgi:hypothetical protein